MTQTVQIASCTMPTVSLTPKLPHVGRTALTIPIAPLMVTPIGLIAEAATSTRVPRITTAVARAHDRRTTGDAPLVVKVTTTMIMIMCASVIITTTATVTIVIGMIVTTLRIVLDGVGTRVLAAVMVEVEIRTATGMGSRIMTTNAIGVGKAIGRLQGQSASDRGCDALLSCEEDIFWNLATSIFFSGMPYGILI